MTKDPVAVIGGGYMGVGIAQTFALAGHPVRLVDADPERTAHSVERARRQLREYVASGQISDARNAGDLIEPTPSIRAAVDGVIYISEAVPESIDLKREVLGAIAAASADAVIATNTSAIELDPLFAAIGGRDHMLAAHWFNPAPFVPLVEVAGGSEDATVRAEVVLTGIGKLPLRVPAVSGFIGNRLQLALYREAALIVEEGLVDAATVDAVVTASFGMRLPFLGPLLAGDMAGLDVYAAAFASLEAVYGARFAPPPSLIARVEAGDVGLKSGGGLRSVDPAERETLLRRRDEALVRLAHLRASLG
ncbi:3-hydroxyacyl-CoA dehydrogenase family protein [Microbacterium karelineae]|uniref:3-hydroxyacyl-CoA dehydrogenase family protein n=1 Tax=Microbacterium karelineae TaxID=2654283 RepID=UPI0012EA92E6|nr:3-hydroxyacyl-CoA dehydrogenase family protein [Microbacterium karelineae]